MRVGNNHKPSTETTDGETMAESSHIKTTTDAGSGDSTVIVIVKKIIEKHNVQLE